MKVNLPSLLYVIRIVIFSSLLACLLWMNNVVSGVVFLIAIAFNICDFVVSSKYGITKVGKINGIILLIFDRMIVVLPLFFATISGRIELWVLLILFVFEFATCTYRYFDFSSGIRKRLNNGVYILYNLALYLSSLLYLFAEFKLAVYFIFSSSLIGCVYIIYSAINMTEESTYEDEIVKEDDPIINALKSEDEIVE